MICLEDESDEQFGEYGREQLPCLFLCSGEDDEAERQQGQTWHRGLHGARLSPKGSPSHREAQIQARR